MPMSTKAGSTTRRIICALLWLQVSRGPSRFWSMIFRTDERKLTVGVGGSLLFYMYHYMKIFSIVQNRFEVVKNASLKKLKNEGVDISGPWTRTDASFIFKKINGKSIGRNVKISNWKLICREHEKLLIRKHGSTCSLSYSYYTHWSNGSGVT